MSTEQMKHAVVFFIQLQPDQTVINYYTAFDTYPSEAYYEEKVVAYPGSCCDLTAISQVKRGSINLKKTQKLLRTCFVNTPVIHRQISQNFLSGD